MSDRETMEVDVLIVGAGPAGLAAAIRLARLAKAAGKRPDELNIAVIEKGKEVGAHIISGAILDPVALRELLPEIDLAKDAPLEGPVEEDFLWYLTAENALPFPVIPPPLENHGNYICSLNKLVRWLGKVAEKEGINVFPGFPGAELLYDGPRVAGVRTADRGIDKHGAKRSGFETGIDLRAKVTILAEGPRGSLTKALVEKQGLGLGKHPQVYATGVKEVWQVPKGTSSRGRVIHTMGWPASESTFGGGFIYTMADDLLSVGYVVGLDYRNPRTDPHQAFQRFKTHPAVAKMLKGGEIRSYGAKTIPEGGWYAVPRTHGDGFLIIGDSAGFLDMQRLKGIHLAMKTGMLAAETAWEALQKGDVSAAALAGFETRVNASYVRTELWRTRNFRQAFEGGFWSGMFHAGIQMLTGGRGLRDPWPGVAGHERMTKLTAGLSVSDGMETRVKPDGRLTFDKVTDVFHSGTVHEENQPAHLKVADTDVCITKCTVEYGNPCQYFCPAHVYEMVPDAKGDRRLQINFANCVHCKTCDVMDPYQIITWTVPEGGGGPDYKLL